MDNSQLIYEGKSYIAVDDALADIKKYEEMEKQDFTIFDSKLLDDKSNPIKYQTVLFTCEYGQKRKSESTGKRESRTLKRNCKASIRLTANDTKTRLVIKSINDNHTNHDEFMKYRMELPKNRALQIKETKDAALELLAMKCPKSQIRKKLIADSGKQIYRKDLDNLGRQLRNPNDDSLDQLLDFLSNDLNANISIFKLNKDFQALFYVTDTMLDDMAASSEIVFTDGTYKLFRRNFILQLFTVEDKYGDTQVVGVGILSNETRTTIQWLLETFKNTHGVDVCNKIKSFMTDKDLTERSILNSIFPQAKTLLCKFHTKKTFKLNFTVRKMNMTLKQADKSLELLNSMVDSTTESEYNKLYKKFERVVKKGSKGLEYFNKNWHNIKTEWTTWGMDQVVNLGNHSNNRMESNHSKIKNHDWMQPNDTLTRAVKNLNEWMVHRKEHQRAARINNHIKIDANPPAGIVGIYKKAMTPFAFKKIQYDLENFNTVVFNKQNNESKECQIIKRDCIIDVDPTKCTCAKWVASLLVCKHILAVRKLFNMPLFDKELCTRWLVNDPLIEKNNKKKYNNVQIDIAPMIKMISEEERLSYLNWIIKQIFFMISNKPADKFGLYYKTLQHFNQSCTKTKRRILTKEIKKSSQKSALVEVTESIKNNMEQMPPEQFQVKYLELQRIESMWKQQKYVINNNELNIPTNELSDLSITENSDNIKSIVLPTPNTIVGRQKKDAIKCTLVKSCKDNKKK